MDTNNTKKFNSLKRRRALIIAVAAAAALLAVLYFAVFRPMLNAREYGEYHLLDGEGVTIAGCRVVGTEGPGKLSYSEDGTVAYSEGGELTLKVDLTDAKLTAGRYYIFRPMASADIAVMRVENKTGKWGFYLATDGNYYLIDYPGTPYDKTLFTTTVSAGRNPLSMKRVDENAPDLKIYGLDESSRPAEVTLSDKSGRTESLLIGDMIQTGGGYYCAKPGSRAVYVLDSSMGIFSSPAEVFVTPLLSLPEKENDYFSTEVFTLTVDGETLVSCGFMSDAERAATASVSTYKMFVPENYVPSSDNYGAILRKFVEFKGTETVAFGKAGEVMSREELAPYGLDDPKYEIYYKYSGVDNYVYVSEKQEDGGYYAFSLLFNLVAKVDADTLDFLEWEFIDFVDRPMFQKNINDVAYVRIEADGVDEEFTITGSSVDDLAVTPKSVGKPFGEKGLKNFRLLFRKMLGLNIESYAPDRSTDNRVLRMTVRTDVGLEYVYDFYAYSTRRCFFTINGVGEFYCLRDRVEKIASDTQALMRGEDLDVADLG
ncbi:MAG: DUF4340 domain-containing protein [Clostridia bacterium]|nr:DUF4340 domain-containing protein [Clostridia bacterium]